MEAVNLSGLSGGGACRAHACLHGSEDAHDVGFRFEVLDEADDGAVVECHAPVKECLRQRLQERFRVGCRQIGQEAEGSSHGGLAEGQAPAVEPVEAGIRCGVVCERGDVCSQSGERFGCLPCGVACSRIMAVGGCGESVGQACGRIMKPCFTAARIHACARVHIVDCWRGRVFRGCFGGDDAGSADHGFPPL